QRAGGVDQLHAVLFGLDGEVRAHAVRRYGDTLEAARLRLLRGRGTFDALAAESLDDLRVVDDVADGRDRMLGIGGVLDDIDRATNAPAIAEGLRDHDLTLAGRLVSRGYGSGRSRCHDDLPVGLEGGTSCRGHP